MRFLNALAWCGLVVSMLMVVWGGWVFTRLEEPEGNEYLRDRMAREFMQRRVAGRLVIWLGVLLLCILWLVYGG